MPPSEERIRQLCNEAVSAADSAALNEVLTELRAALAEHIRSMRMMAAEGVPRLFRSGHDSAD